VALADPEVDFTGIDEVVVLATPNANVIAYGPTWTGGSFDDGSITPDGQYITNGVTSGVDILYWGYLWLPHEMGHSLSFVDVYDYDGRPGYSGEFSLMNDIAGHAPEYLAWERWHAGWLDDDQILCVASDTTATIGPIEVSGGPKAAVVKVGPNRVVVIESRRAVGYDHALQREGAVVYVVDTSIESGYGPIQVANDRLALLPGESVTVDGVTVTVSGATAAGDTIIIDL
jgi:M6 family metalloprotease-like protein